MCEKFHIFKYHPLVKLTIFFYLYYTSFFHIFLTDFQSALFDILYISFTALKPIFPSPSENLNLVFVIICITAIAMGPR